MILQPKSKMLTQSVTQLNHSRYSYSQQLPQ